MTAEPEAPAPIVPAPMMPSAFPAEPLAAPLPPDPDAYDAPRNVRARAKGLPAPYIAGGLDPNPGPGLAEERRYTRWLVWMVAGLVFGGFILGVIIALATGDLSGNMI